MRQAQKIPRVNSFRYFLEHMHRLSIYHVFSHINGVFKIGK